MGDREKRFSVNEIFYSQQGEGARVGTPNVFIRLAGCNLRCHITPGPQSPGGFSCDTNFSGGRLMTAQEIIGEARSRGGLCNWVVLTGGEPLLQLDDELITALLGASYRIALETNGTRPVPDGIQWVTVSPKVAEHALEAQRADELKYVIADGQALPRPKLKASHYFISPACSQDGFYTPETLRWCYDLVMNNPQQGWRLSIQTHKLLGVR
jgi:7-carboxy-7-deazaguanine synthase